MLALAAAGVFVLASSGPVSAHELRIVGKYRFLVGFGHEPAYGGQENFVQFFLDTKAGNPVGDIGTLKVQVVAGGQRKTLAFEPSFDPDSGLGTRGEYDAFFFPTTLGKYTFRILGKVGGQRVEQFFTSGPTTFSEVESPTSVEFPTQVPTTADIAQRLARETPRIDSALADQRSSLESKIDSARLLGIIGLIVGAIGLAAGATALALRKKG